MYIDNVHLETVYFIPETKHTPVFRITSLSKLGEKKCNLICSKKMCNNSGTKRTQETEKKCLKVEGFIEIVHL